MNMKPILFKGEMVRAIQDGRKTQTRRVIKPQPVHAQVYDYKGERLYDGEHRLWWWKRLWYDLDTEMQERLALLYSPYGQPGDRLWVRETFAENKAECGEPIVYRADNSKGLRYQHTANIGVTFDVDRWKPSIHMPRWASRITLEITAVRVERLQDIRLDGLIAEGFDLDRLKWRDWPQEDGSVIRGTSSRHDFEELWNSINEKRGYSWESNPWVWVYEFKVIE